MNRRARGEPLLGFRNPTNSMNCSRRPRTMDPGAGVPSPHSGNSRAARQQRPSSSHGPWAMDPGLGVPSPHSGNSRAARQQRRRAATDRGLWTPDLEFPRRTPGAPELLDNRDRRAAPCRSARQEPRMNRRARGEPLVGPTNPMNSTNPTNKWPRPRTTDRF